MGVREVFGKDVLLTGWGHSRFGKLADETLESLIVQVATEAIGNAGIEPGQIDEIYLGQFNSGMMPLASLLPGPAGLRLSWPTSPSTRVENACASGSAAFQQGTKSLLAGTAQHRPGDRRREDDPRRRPTSWARPCSARTTSMAGKASSTGFAGLFAEVAKHYEKRYGPESATSWAPSPPRTTATACDNPYAQLRKDLGEEFCRTVSEKNPMVAEPLRRTDCSPGLDGAAAVVLSVPPTGGRHRPGAARRLRPGQRLPPRRAPGTRSSSPPRGPPGSGPWGWPASGLEDLDFAEVHDCFTIAELVMYEAMGLGRTRPGRAGPLEEGWVYQGRQAAGQRLRRAQGQGPPRRRHRRLPARHRRHAALRHGRRHAAGRAAPGRGAEHGRRGHGQLRQRARGGLTRRAPGGQPRSAPACGARTPHLPSAERLRRRWAASTTTTPTTAPMTVSTPRSKSRSAGGRGWAAWPMSRASGVTHSIATP